MLTALWNGLKRLLWDEAFGKRAFGYIGIILGGVLMQVFAWGWDDVKDWTRQEWLWRIGATFALAIGASFLGQRNLTGDKLLAAIEEAQGAKKAGLSLREYRKSKGLPEPETSPEVGS